MICPRCKKEFKYDVDVKSNLRYLKCCYLIRVRFNYYVEVDTISNKVINWALTDRGIYQDAYYKNKLIFKQQTTFGQETIDLFHYVYENLEFI